MPSLTEWKVPPANQPRPGDYAFDLDRVLLEVPDAGRDDPDRSKRAKSPPATQR